MLRVKRPASHSGKREGNGRRGLAHSRGLAVSRGKEGGRQQTSGTGEGVAEGGDYWVGTVSQPPSILLFPLLLLSLPLDAVSIQTFYTSWVAQLDPRRYIFFLAVGVIAQLIPLGYGCPQGKSTLEYRSKGSSLPPSLFLAGKRGENWGSLASQSRSRFQPQFLLWGSRIGHPMKSKKGVRLSGRCQFSAS